jgi:hypothetical protein
MSRFTVDFLADYSNDAILEELKRIASLHGSPTLTKAQLELSGRVSYALVNKRFGSLRQALQLAGLTPQRFMNATDAELLELIVELWEQVLEKEGRTPQRKDLSAYKFPVSGDTIIRRFGTWKKALLKAYESVQEGPVEPEQPGQAIQSIVRVRNPLSLRKRFFVMKRDGFACVRCGASGPGIKLEVHHIIPFAQGGSDGLDNLQTLCFECNRGQRDDAI